MANRSMEAKRNKMKRMKRLAPKRYSSDYIPVGQGPNTFVMSEYRARTVSLAFDPAYLQHLEDNAPFKNVPPGKLEIREKLTALQAAGYHDKIGYAIISNMYQKCMLYRNSDHTEFRLCHEDFKKKTIRWSISYPSKARALQVWNMNKVTWIEVRSISDSS